MNSPFPGMDPYLEAHWGDVHSRLVLYSCDQIQQLLPSDLVARVEERLVVEPEDGDERTIYPDVRVFEHERGGATAASAGATFAEPVVIEYSEPATETSIHIVGPAPAIVSSAWWSFSAAPTSLPARAGSNTGRRS